MKEAKVNTVISTSGLKAVFAILCKWKCSTHQQIEILGISRSSYYKYRRAPYSARLNADQLERISLILNLHANLRTLFENPDNVYGFMRMPNHNQPFKGQSPLAYISDGYLISLKEAAQHVEAALAGLW